MSESSPFFVLVPIVGFLIFFPLMWSFVSFIVATFSGWRHLAERYATDRQITGDSFHMRSGRMGSMSNYSSTLNVTVSSEAIWLRTIILFRVGHKPLLIPWHDVKELTVGKLLFSKATTLMVQPLGDSKVTRIVIYGRDVAESLQRHSPPEFRFESDYV